MNINWSAAGSLAHNAGAWGVIYGDKFVAIGNGSGYGDAWTSPDGITWTQRALGANASNAWQGPAYGAGTYVAVGQDYQNVATSPDGITWTIASTALPSADTWYGCVYAAGVFVTVAANATATNEAAYSSDGVTWHGVSMPTSLGYFYPVFGVSKFFAGENASTTAYAYSSDGITWSAGVLPAADTWKFVASPTLVLAYGATNNILYYSTDGISWTAGVYPPALIADPLCYASGYFVGCDANLGRSCQSADGVSWSYSSMGSTGQYVMAGTSTKEFVAIYDGTNSSPHSLYGYLSPGASIVMLI